MSRPDIMSAYEFMTAVKKLAEIVGPGGSGTVTQTNSDMIITINLIEKKN